MKLCSKCNTQLDYRTKGTMCAACLVVEGASKLRNCVDCGKQLSPLSKRRDITAPRRLWCGRKDLWTAFL